MKEEERRNEDEKGEQRRDKPSGESGAEKPL
jgi:hypothetical protein